MPLAKKPLKESIKALREYEVFGSDYVTAIVIQQTLGGHAIPVDAPIRRALVRLGVADPDTDIATLRGILERAVPKNRGAEFVELLEDLAHDTCVEGPPDCPRCELRKICPTGLARKEERASTKAVAAKHRQGRLGRVETRPRRDDLGWRLGRSPETRPGGRPATPSEGDGIAPRRSRGGPPRPAWGWQWSNDRANIKRDGRDEKCRRRRPGGPARRAGAPCDAGDRPGPVASRPKRDGPTCLAQFTRREER